MSNDDKFLNIPYTYTNRLLCEVLDEINRCYETRNFSPIKGLVSEARILGTRMEAGLSDQKDIQKLSEYRHELKQEVKKLQKEYNNLKKKVKKR